MIHIVAFSLVVLGASAWADEPPVVRSSHPRGFVSGGAMPPMTTANPNVSPGSGAGQGASSTTAIRSTQGSNQTTASGGVSVTGNTRIDARAQGGVAAAVGEQNTAGNRVGNIGGK